MKTELLSTVFLSEKRKNILLMLMDGPTTIDEIKESMIGTTSAIMAQVKILLEQGLIELKDGECELTYIGKIILMKMQPLVETLNVLEKNKEYWENRDLSGVPDDLLDRIGELGEVIIDEPKLDHLFEPPKDLLNSLKQTNKVSTLYSYFCPTCPMNYSKLAKQGTEFELILTRSVYNRLKEDYEEQYDAMMESNNSNLFVCEDNTINLGTISITDDLIAIAFFNRKGTLDHKTVISFEESAIKWGQELISYYKQNSERVK